MTAPVCPRNESRQHRDDDDDDDDDDDGEEGHRRGLPPPPPLPPLAARMSHTRTMPVRVCWKKESSFGHFIFDDVTFSHY